MTIETVRIAIPEPHSDLQMDMITYPGSSVNLCGRRFGKTEGGAQRILYWMQLDPGLYWWVGLSWKSASMKRAWRELTNVAKKVALGLGLRERDVINNTKFEITLPGMGEIWFRTAENPTSLAGEGIKGAVIDEFTLMKEVVWTEYLQGTLLDYDGWAFFIGVPKGMNWGADMFLSCDGWDNWKSRTATTYDNPYISREGTDRIRSQVRKEVFDQEYLAKIVEGANNAPFVGVNEAAIAKPQTQAIPGHTYSAGLDWGKRSDFTVLSIYDIDLNEIPYYYMIQDSSYVTQAKRIKEALALFSPDIIFAERNAMGDAVIDILEDIGVWVTPIDTTNQSKDTWITGLSIDIEFNGLKILNDKEMINQFLSMRGTKLPSGRIRYEAAPGNHDDIVISCCLARLGAPLSGPGVPF